MDQDISWTQWLLSGAELTGWDAGIYTELYRHSLCLTSVVFSASWDRGLFSTKMIWVRSYFWSTSVTFTYIKTGTEMSCFLSAGHADGRTVGLINSWTAVSVCLSAVQISLIGFRRWWHSVVSAASCSVSWFAQKSVLDELNIRHRWSPRSLCSESWYICWNTLLI